MCGGVCRDRLGGVRGGKRLEDGGGIGVRWGSGSKKGRSGRGGRTGSSDEAEVVRHRRVVDESVCNHGDNLRQRSIESVNKV